MMLPTIEQPGRYAGLYVFDFGDWTAVGYTAEEIAILLESEEYRDGKVYKIHRATPDGQMELRGISGERFNTESGMFFYRKELDAAQTDFDQILTAVDTTPPPARAFLHLADRGDTAKPRFAVAMIFPAEDDEEISRWLLDIGFEGGDFVEGGPSAVTNYYQEEKAILDRRQLWSQNATPSRSPEEIFATVRRAVQR